MRKNKLILLGDSGVGKTSIVRRWITNTFYENQSPTIGSAYVRTTFRFRDEEKEVQVWDTAGEERFRSMAPMYSKDAFAAVIVFSLLSKSSLENIPFWIDALNDKDNTPIILIGNKFDFETGIEVTPQEAISFASRFHCDYFATSALTGHGVSEAFESLLNKAFLKLETLPKSPIPNSVSIGNQKASKSCY